MVDVITIGGGTRDIFLELDEGRVVTEKKGIKEKFFNIPYGEKILAQDTHYSYGGGAVNSAVSFSRLGLRVASFCNIGAEGTGTLLVNKLKKEKVNTSLVQRDSEHHTGLSIFIIGKDGDHTGFLERGANSYINLKNISQLKRTKWLYLTSLTGESAKILPEIFALAKKYRIKIAWNPGSQQIAEGYQGVKNLIPQTEILILNLEEAEKLVHSKIGRRPKTEKEVCAELEKMGATITVVTNGEKGSAAIFEGNIFSQKSYSGKAIDTTGAGDSFGSTFTFGIIKGFDFRYCLKIAAINSASVVEKMGAQDGLLSYNNIKRSKWL